MSKKNHIPFLQFMNRGRHNTDFMIRTINAKYYLRKEQGDT